MKQEALLLQGQGRKSLNLLIRLILIVMVLGVRIALLAHLVFSAHASARPGAPMGWAGALAGRAPVAPAAF
jgi:hypothetical protein